MAEIPAGGGGRNCDPEVSVNGVTNPQFGVAGGPEPVGRQNPGSVLQVYGVLFVEPSLARALIIVLAATVPTRCPLLRVAGAAMSTRAPATSLARLGVAARNRHVAE